MYEKVTFVGSKFCGTESGVWEERRAIPQGEFVCVMAVAVLWSVTSRSSISDVMMMVARWWTDLLQCMLLGFEPLTHSTKRRRMSRLSH